MTPLARPASTAYRASTESRLGGFLFALAMVALLILMLIRMGAFPGEEPGRGSHLVAVDFSHSSPAAAAAAKAAVAVRQAVAPIVPLPLVPPPRAIIPLKPQPAIVAVSSADFAASDIGKLGKSSGASSGSGKPVYGPGEGPGGAQLFPAEWVREPTDAELVTYLPSRGVPPGSWATIACQTIEHFHVENCQPLSEAPLGSGLSRGLRNAAWQFLVRPPRNGGQYEVGTWVRIRFTFTRQKNAPSDDDGQGAG